MDDASTVGVLQGLPHLDRNAGGFVDRQSVIFGLLQHAFEVAARHELADDVGLSAAVWTVFFANVENGDDVGVVAQATHSLSLVAHAGQPGLVQPFCLDDSDGHVAVEAVVVGEVDALAAALAKEALHLVAAAGERRRQGGRGLRRRRAGLGFG